MGARDDRLGVHGTKPAWQSRNLHSCESRSGKSGFNLSAELKENGVTANVIQVRAIDVHARAKAQPPMRSWPR